MPFAVGYCDEFSDMHDTNDILFVGEEKTYELIEAMLKFYSDNFTSRSVNIGMDEAFAMLLGKYLKNTATFGIREEVAYRNLDGKTLDNEAVNKFSDNLTLIFWDYYNDNVSFYDEVFKKY